MSKKVFNIIIEMMEMNHNKIKKLKKKNKISKEHLESLQFEVRDLEERYQKLVTNKRDVVNNLEEANELLKDVLNYKNVSMQGSIDLKKRISDHLSKFEDDDEDIEDELKEGPKKSKKILKSKRKK